MYETPDFNNIDSDFLSNSQNDNQMYFKPLAIIHYNNNDIG